eukprot:scaffold1197_cov121-Isochrysis_galbana.AAC.10
MSNATTRGRAPGCAAIPPAPAPCGPEPGPGRACCPRCRPKCRLRTNPLCLAFAHSTSLLVSPRQPPCNPNLYPDFRPGS